jgi:hypothetical protein
MALSFKKIIKRLHVKNLNTSLLGAAVFLSLILFVCSSVLAGDLKDSDNELQPLAISVSVGAEEQISDNIPGIHGYLYSTYRLRFTEDESDQDLFQYVSLDVGDPRKHKVTSHIFARGAYDIDGDQDIDDYYVFDSINDSYDSSFNGRLYYAYLDVHRVERMDLIRVGRQTMYDSPVILYFDGVLTETSEVKSILNTKLGLYGGVPVHLYEDDSEGDALYGAFVQFRPWVGGRAKLHWIHLEDDNQFGEENDDHYSFGLWQAINEKFQLFVEYKRLEDKNRDVSLRTTYFNPEKDLMVQCSYYDLLETQEISSIEFDPFFASEFKYYPYWQANLSAYKGLGENWGIEGGFDIRRLKDDADEGDFNHGFTRYFLSLFLLNIPNDSFEISTTAEIWDSENEDEEIQSYGADLSYRVSDKTKTSFGTIYGLYKYDYYRDTEKDEVQTYYMKMKYSVSNQISLDMRYEFEDDDFDEYHLFKLGAMWAF